MTSNGMLSSMDLPEGEWDQDITMILTRKQTNEVKNQPDKYKYIAYTTTFDFLDYHNEYYEITLRIVRFKIAEGVYECLVTNLSSDEMAFESMKELYHLRWNEETSFRALKYNIGLVHFHSKKREFIRQEIYARLIIFNLSKAIVNVTDAEKQGKKYKYKTDYASALTNIRAFMRKLISVEKLLPMYYTRQQVEQVFDISKNYADLLPIRVQSEQGFAGHLLICFMATAIMQKLQQELLKRRSKKAKLLNAESIFSYLRNQKCKVYKDYAIPQEPRK